MTLGQRIRDEVAWAVKHGKKMSKSELLYDRRKGGFSCRSCILRNDVYCLPLQEDIDLDDDCCVAWKGKK